MLMGNSGGGTATVYTAAIDERISIAVPSCAVCTYKHSIAAMRHCVCNFVPNIADYFDMGGICLIEWAQNIAPLLPKRVKRVCIRKLSENEREIEYE